MQTRQSQIEREVLAYLAEHPDTQDTLEGIVEWWLLEQKIQRQTALVKRALAGLVSCGLVSERQGPDARIRYQVNRERLNEIKELIADTTG